MHRLTQPGSKSQDAFEVQVLNELGSIKETFGVIIDSVKGVIAEHVRQSELSDKRIETIISNHVEDDSKNFGELRNVVNQLKDATLELSIATKALTQYIDGKIKSLEEATDLKIKSSSKGSVSWSWFLTTLIGVVIAMAAQFKMISAISEKNSEQASAQVESINRLTTRIDKIEFVANNE